MGSNILIIIFLVLLVAADLFEDWWERRKMRQAAYEGYCIKVDGKHYRVIPSDQVDAWDLRDMVEAAAQKPTLLSKVD